ncbi:DUF6703 family protein [Actinomadura macrotermitis]|uniref:DUF6703 family protein n=1 Tax=Actinomadura macrotermitis TaxID=2585200 RepID=UPI001296C770|nr:DUF6703 family protein [Actinomadura macrotermitis]
MSERDGASGRGSGQAGPSGTRAAVERWSAGPLALLHRRRSALLVAVLVLLVAGMLAPGPAGAGCLVVLLALLGWLSYLSWPALAVRDRLLRLGGMALLVAVAVERALT